jgi:O-antigen ligase
MNMEEIPGQLPPTSKLDQVFAGSLILLGVIVIARRRDWMAVLKTGWPIVLYFAFCLASLTWSDYPEWGFKRWIRALGDVIMVLVVVTDAQPAAALRRLFSRVGFVLLPASILLIRYFPNLGRGWTIWGNVVVNTGVSTNKNSLGALVYLISLGTLWQLIVLLRDKTQPNRTRRLVAQGTLLYFGISLLHTAQSATSLACFVLGAGFMVVTARPFFRARPAAVNALMLGVLLAGGITVLLGGQAEAAAAFGRNSTLTGRTELWQQVIPLVPSAIGGAGFETFWVGPRVSEFYAIRGGLTFTNEAHNGYVEVFLNLGWLGVCLIALILGQGYRKTVSVIRRDPALGVLLAANVITVAIYSVTEAGFRILCLPWFFLLLSILAASRLITLGEAASTGVESVPIVLARNSDALDLNPTLDRRRSDSARENLS